MPQAKGLHERLFYLNSLKVKHYFFSKFYLFIYGRGHLERVRPVCMWKLVESHSSWFFSLTTWTPGVEFGTTASRQAHPLPTAEPSHWPSVICKEDPELPAPKSSTSGRALNMKTETASLF